MTVHLGDAQWAQFRSRILARSQALLVRSAVQVYGTWTAGDGKGAENCVAMAAVGIDSVGTNFATCTKQFEDSRFEKYNWNPQIPIQKCHFITVCQTKCSSFSIRQKIHSDCLLIMLERLDHCRKGCTCRATP